MAVAADLHRNFLTPAIHRQAVSAISVFFVRCSALFFCVSTFYHKLHCFSIAFGKKVRRPRLCEADAILSESHLAQLKAGDTDAHTRSVLKILNGKAVFCNLYSLAAVEPTGVYYTPVGEDFYRILVFTRERNV